ncbi:MAG TPA: peptidylprolyl isomerase [Pyrinomonadaceae bacterium]|nr:peptidylprolyl isomerase [Pyrinomonadaceae bacterium]
MKFINSAIFSIAVILVLSFSAFAQETQERVVDEVVAQVNDGVITLSRVKREMKNAVDAYVAEGKSREEGEKLMEEKKGELIANLINEELIIQKAKEAGLEKEIEANLNQRFLEIMKEQKIKSLETLYEAMRSQGVSPEEIRELWRKQATREAVITREVSQKIYWQPDAKELKAFYEKNKEKFTKPEKITISEIFLSFAGRDEAAVREKAKKLVAQLKGGADFAKLAVENSDRENVAQNKGKVDTFNVKDLDPRFAEALKSLKAGGVTEPIEVDQVGMEILHVDDRSEASNESVFDENAVRYAIMQEKAPAEQKKFMSTLRQDAYIKINEQYRPIVSPILFADERRAEKTDK